MMNAIRSPLQYPGGKRWLYNALTDYIPAETKEVLSPFIGGGSIEITLASKGIKVYGYDICPHLTNFWQQWVICQDKIREGAKSILRQFTRKSLQQEKEKLYFQGKVESLNKHEQALWYYLFNRLSFHGKTLEDNYIVPYVEIEGEFKRVKPYPDGRKVNIFPEFHQVKKYNLSVENVNFKESLEKHPSVFAYLDPPYIDETNNYYSGGSFDHKELSSYLRKRDRWILSYSDSEQIKGLYKNLRSIPLTNKRVGGFQKDKKPTLLNEILILSPDIEIYPQQIELFK